MKNTKLCRLRRAIITSLSICLMLISFEQLKAQNSWLGSGNNISANDWFGAKNAFPVIFKTNNIQRMILTTEGFFGINVSTALAPLHVNGEIIFINLGGSSDGLVCADPTGKLKRISFTGNNRHVLLGDGTFDEYWDSDWLVVGNNMFAMPTGTVSFGVENPDTSYKVVIGGDTKIQGELSIGNSIKLNGITDQITTTTGTLDFGTTNLSTTGTIKTDNITTTSGTLNLGNTNIVTTGNIDAHQVTLSGNTSLEDATVNNLTVNELTTTNRLVADDYIEVGNTLQFTGTQGDINSTNGLNITTTEGNIILNSGENTIINSKLGVGVNSPIEMVDVQGNVNVRGYLYVQNGVIIGQRIQSERVQSDTLEVSEKINTQNIEISRKLSAKRSVLKTIESERITTDTLDIQKLQTTQMESVSLLSDSINTDQIRTEVSLSKLAVSESSETILAKSDEIRTKTIDATGDVKAMTIITDRTEYPTINIDGINSTITSSTGNIDFDNETLTTSGRINAGDVVAEYLTATEEIYTDGTITAANINAQNMTINTASYNTLQVNNSLTVGTNTLILSSDQEGTDVENNIYTESGDLFIQSNADNSNNVILNYSNDGKVGVGTNNPLGKFQVGSGMSKVVISDHFVIPNTYWNASYIGFNAARNEGTSLWNFGTNGYDNGGSIILNDVGGNIRFISIKSNQTSGAPERNLTDETILNNTKFVINKDGKVGIGTPNPVKTLHIRDFTPSDEIVVDNQLGDIGGSLRLENEVEFQGSTIWDIEPIYNADATLKRLQFTNQGIAVLSLSESGKVGVGTSEPLGKLQIGKGLSKILLSNSFSIADATGTYWNASYLGFNAGRKSDGNWQFDTDGYSNGGSLILNSSGGSMRFITVPNSTAGTQQIISEADILDKTKMTINNNGVGVGTDDPIGKLHVKGGDNAVVIESNTEEYSDISFRNTFGLTASEKIWTLRTHSNSDNDLFDNSLELFSDKGGPVIIKNSQTNYADLWTVNDEFSYGFGIDDDNKLHIYSDLNPANRKELMTFYQGKVGIALPNGSTPTSTIHMSGDVKIDDLADQINFTTRMVVATNTGKLETRELPDISTLCSAITCNGGSLSIGYPNTNNFYLNVKGLINFETLPDKNADTQAKMVVKGTDGLLGIHDFPNISDICSAITCDYEKIEIGNLSTKKLNLGMLPSKSINNFSSSYLGFNLKYNITGYSADGFDSSVGEWISEHAGNNNGGSAIINSLNGDMSFVTIPNQNDAQDLLFDDTQFFSKVKMIITSDGNVGIGTNTIGSKLHVKQNGGAFNLEGTDHVYIQFFPDGYTNGRKGWFGYGNVDDNNLTIQNQITDANIVLGTSGVGKVKIDNLPNNLSGTLKMVVADVNGYIGTKSIEAECDIITCDGDERVGIGTTTPSSGLHVNTNNGGASSNWYDPANYATTIHQNSNSVKHYGLLVSDRWRNSENFVFAVDGRFTNGSGSVAEDTHNPYFVVRGDGNIGIGTTTPHEKLSVEGNVNVSGVINCERVNVEVNVVPDYVFEKGYTLISLDEIEQYVYTHKHLPEIPSEKEIKQNGMNLGEMNILLLKKIEELTLYTIDQQKQINELKTVVEQLKK